MDPAQTPCAPDNDSAVQATDVERRSLEKNFPILAAKAREAGMPITEFVLRTIKDINCGKPP